MKKIPKSIKTLLVVLIIYLLVKIFVIDISIIDGMSMFPTLEQNEIILINKLKKDYPTRGDIVIFKSPTKKYISKEEYNSNNLIATYDENSIFQKNLVKRVIGLPGEHIQIKKDRKVYINGIALEEQYIVYDTTYETYAFIDIIIPENSVYVMGDNRHNSIDSRSFGCIPISKIKGCVNE